MLQIGSLVDGKYRILDEVGRGGMSVVYLARNVRTNKQWAIKEVRKDGANDFNVVRANLIAETDILKKLNHPNLPNIIDILDDGDSFVIIMDFIEGNSLQHYIKHSGAQPEQDVVKWAIQLCDVLGYLHSRTPPIIYRDMKPANVMLKPDGNICLIDFGTAREYKTASLEDTKNLGTQGYAAPEQYGGQGQTDARTDIYTLGATMYHLLTGDSPANHLFEPLRIRDINPYLSEGLETVILKCTESNPDDRYQSCEELMYALNNYNTLTDTYRRQQRNKLIGFFTSLALTIAFTVSFFVLGNVYDKTLLKNYENLVEDAEIAVANDDYSLAMEKYQSAVNSIPERPEAYLSALKKFKEDGNFDNEDGNRMRQLMTGGSDNENNESKLAAYMENWEQNGEESNGYAELCYQLGMAYALGRENGSGLSTAESYLQRAKATGDIRNEGSQKKATILESLLSMCELNQAKSSDAAIDNMDEFKSFDVYWDSLYQYYGQDVRDTLGSERFEIEFYRFVLARISDTTIRFLNDGVDPQEMFNMIDQAEAALDDDELDFEGARSAVRAAQDKMK